MTKKYFLYSLLAFLGLSFYAQGQCPASDACSHSVDLYDAFQDGWNGTEVTIYQNGVAVAVLGANFSTGATYNTSVQLCDSMEAYFVLTTGSIGSPYWSEEISFDVLDPFGFASTSFGGSTNMAVGDTLASAIINCTAPTCPPPTGLGDTALSTTTADIYWTGGGASNWDVEYGPGGFSLGAGTSASVTNDTMNITGLTSNLAYEFYVRDSCGPGDVSAWAGPYRFGSEITPCDDFEAYSAGAADVQSSLFKDWGSFLSGAEISTDYAVSGSNSLKVDDSAGTPQVIYADVGLFDSGMWNISFDIYVPTGHGAFYNITHNYIDEVNAVLGPSTFFDASGTATVEQGTFNTVTLGSFGYNPGAWNRIEHIVDLDNDSSYILINGSYALGWRFSLDTTTFGDQFNAVTFASVGPMGQPATAYIDNFCITPATPVSCAVPSALGAFNISMSSAELYWTGGGASDWNLEYGPAGFSLGSGNRINSSNDSLSITGLTSGTAYQFYVRDSCGPGDVSFWTGPHSFFTPLCSAADKCSYTFSMNDAFGDGWNGTEVTVYQNNIPVATVGSNFTEFTGTPPGINMDTTIQLCDSLETHFVLSTGSVGDPFWSEEISFDLIDPFGVTLASFTGSGNMVVGDTLATGMAYCTPPSCPRPTALGSTPTSNTSAEVYWTGGGASHWQIEYGPSGFSLGTGTSGNVSNDSLVISGLTANAPYDFYVRDSCGPGDLSMWAGPFQFGAEIIPCDHFDNHSTGSISTQTTLFNTFDSSLGDGEVSTDYAASGSNSLRISGFDPPQVVYADVALQTAGVWSISFDLYIPSGGGSYYNITHQIGSGSNPALGPGTTFDGNGTAMVQVGSFNPVTIGTYSYTPNAWNNIEHIVDLDNDTTYVMVNGSTALGWQFSLDTVHLGDQFDAVLFASITPFSQPSPGLGYYDNFCVTPTSHVLCNAGNDATDTICDSITSVDLTPYLGTHDYGGTWHDDNSTGALSDSIFDLSAVATNSSYAFTYVVSDSNCIDSATVSLYVDDCGIGLDEHSQSLLSVFPNPSTGLVYIEQASENESVMIEVYSSSGQLILETKSEEAQTLLDLSSFADGIYNIKVTHAKGVEIHRLAKQ